MEYCTVCELLCHNYRGLPGILAYLGTLEMMEKMYVCKKKIGTKYMIVFPVLLWSVDPTYKMIGVCMCFVSRAQEVRQEG